MDKNTSNLLLILLVGVGVYMLCMHMKKEKKEGFVGSSVAEAACKRMVGNPPNAAAIVKGCVGAIDKLSSWCGCDVGDEDCMEGCKKIVQQFLKA